MSDDMRAGLIIGMPIGAAIALAVTWICFARAGLL